MGLERTSSAVTATLRNVEFVLYKQTGKSVTKTNFYDASEHVILNNPFKGGGTRIAQNSYTEVHTYSSRNVNALSALPARLWPTACFVVHESAHSDA
jgi:hypothetical protein